MIVIGICAGPTDKFDSIAKPGIDSNAHDAKLFVLRDQRSIASAYNQILDDVAGLDGVEFVVLIHDDVELLPGWSEDIRGAMRDRESVVVVGPVGGTGGGGMAWFSRRTRLGVPHPVAKPSQVEVVDGYLLALSPSAASHLRFDDSYPSFHGYDADICEQARSLGGQVVVASISAAHRNSGIYGTKASHAAWVRSTIQWSLKWQPLTRRQRLARRIRLKTLPVELRLRPSTRATRRRLR